MPFKKTPEKWRRLPHRNCIRLRMLSRNSKETKTGPFFPGFRAPKQRVFLSPEKRRARAWRPHWLSRRAPRKTARGSAFRAGGRPAGAKNPRARRFFRGFWAPGGSARGAFRRAIGFVYGFEPKLRSRKRLLSFGAQSFKNPLCVFSFFFGLLSFSFFFWFLKKSFFFWVFKFSFFFSVFKKSFFFSVFNFSFFFWVFNFSLDFWGFKISLKSGFFLYI